MLGRKGPKALYTAGLTGTGSRRCRGVSVVHADKHGTVRKSNRLGHAMQERAVISFGEQARECSFYFLFVPDAVGRLLRILVDAYPHRPAFRSGRVLEMDSTGIPVYGRKEHSAYNGHFESTCYHPLLLFNGGATVWW